jgi:hypothetical protein
MPYLGHDTPGRVLYPMADSPRRPQSQNQAGDTSDARFPNIPSRRIRGSSRGCYRCYRTPSQSMGGLDSDFAQFCCESDQCWVEDCYAPGYRVHLREYCKMCRRQTISTTDSDVEIILQQKPEVLSLRSNEILTAVVQGARREETNAEVNLAAMRALYNSLEFVRENFEREVCFAAFNVKHHFTDEHIQGERNYLMQVVCEATQNASVLVQVAAFECLVRIMGLYYDKMGFYMERALFGVSHLIGYLIVTRD